MWKFVINFACLASLTNKYMHTQTHTHTHSLHRHICNVVWQVYRQTADKCIDIMCVCVCACSVSLTVRRSLSTCVCVCFCTLSVRVFVSCLALSIALSSTSTSTRWNFVHTWAPHDINFRWIVIRAVQFAFRFLVVRSSRAAPRSVRRPCRDVIDWITHSASINS